MPHPLVSTVAVSAFAALGIGSLPASVPPPPPSEPAPAPFEATVITVDGRAVSFTCAGAGEPTVVLIGGLGLGVETFAGVQAGIAEQTRVCAWDRPGYGASDPLEADDDYDVDEYADELDDVLEASGEPGPYVLAGHSYGGLIALAFADEEPTDTAGVVLLDASHPDMLDALAATPQILALQDAELEAARAENPESTPVREYDALEASLRQTGEVGDIGDIPLLVVAHGASLEEWLPAEVLDGFGLDQATIDTYEAAWRGLQEDYTTWSTNSSLVVAEGLPHSLYFGDPTFVIDTVSEFATTGIG